MNKLLMFTIITAAAFAASGCGTAAPASNAGAIRTTSNSGVISANTNSAPAGVPANQSVPGIAAVPGSTNVDPNVPAAGNVARGDKRRVVDAPSSGQGQAAPGIPSAEDSSISTTMANDGSFVQTRVFNSDPAIAKFEKTSNGKIETVRIFLRTGKVVQIAGDKVPAVNSISLERLRTLAGIKQAARPADPAKAGATSGRPKG